MSRKREKKSGGGIVSRIFLLAFVALFCVAAYKVSSQLLVEHRESSAFDELIAQMEAGRQAGGNAALDWQNPQSGEAGDDETDPAPEPTMLPMYAPLYAQNQDLFGWIEIEDTVLNYPVMHTPEDPEYYLHNAFDRTYSFSGVPFLAAGCFENCGNYIVYGHNMKNGTMFAEITRYAQEDYWREHPAIRFDTLYEAGTYDVIAAFYSKAYAEGVTGVFRYYGYVDLSDPEVFEEYAEQVKAAALYDTEIEAEYGDQLLTLSTCEYHAENGRFVVVARKRRPEA